MTAALYSAAPPTLTLLCQKQRCCASWEPAWAIYGYRGVSVAANWPLTAAGLASSVLKGPGRPLNAPYLS